MTASAQVRAQRPYEQEKAAGRDTDFNTVLAEVERRDALDSSREISPLRPAEDAEVIDTSKMSREEVLDSLIRVIERSAQ